MITCAKCRPLLNQERANLLKDTVSFKAIYRKSGKESNRDKYSLLKKLKTIYKNLTVPIEPLIVHL